MKKILTIISFSILFFLTSVFAEEKIIEIDKKNYRMELNSTQKVDFSVNLDKPFELEALSSDDKIVQVELQETSIILTALTPGKVTVTLSVSSGDQTYNEAVQVEILPAKGKITFDKDVFYLIRGLYYDIEYVLEPKTIDKSNIVWTSSNPEIASVENGRVTGHKVGNTIITATVDGNEASMELFVTVPLEKIVFNPNKILIELEESVAIPDIIYVPYDTTSNRSVSYSVEDDSIVSIENGMLKGLKEGKTTVIADVNGITTDLNVTVKRKAKQSDVQPLLLKVIEEDDSFLTLGVHEAEDYTGGKYELLLPQDDIQKYMEERSDSKVLIRLEDDLRREKFTYLENMEVSKDLLLLLGAQKLEFVLTDLELNPLISLKFNKNVKTSYHFSFNLNKIDPMHSLYPVVKQSGGYQLKLKEVGDDAIEFGIHRRFLDSQQDQLHFVYEYSDDKINEIMDPIEVDAQGFVKFPLISDEMIISVVPLSSQGNWIFYTLTGLVVMIVLMVLFKAFSKRTKNVL